MPAPAGGLTGLLSAPGDGPLPTGLLPASGDGLLPAPGDGLDPAGGLSLPDPLGDGRLVDVRPGTNSADLNGVTPALPKRAVTAEQRKKPSPRPEIPALLGSLPLLDGVTPAPLESGPFAGGVPLLGGLGGLLPVNEMPGGVPALPGPSGLPAGGTDVTPSALAGAPSEPVDDPRVHEEPVDDEAQRHFSTGGRPVAGADRDF
ncbi:hypothetical protein Asp14428_51890 [Actinoplanes sp. NBRC 14428]|nr:hypothetical protein Asp14428_51890 [Actinoplanes sp. NBRC 14428]